MGNGKPHFKYKPQLAETVQAEALALGYRREAVRQQRPADWGLRGPTAPLFAVAERVRELAAELGIDEAARRLEDDRRVATPSALIRTMRADWPDQSRAVQAYAKRHGLPLGEAWALLIAETVDRLEKRRRR